MSNQTKTAHKLHSEFSRLPFRATGQASGYRTKYVYDDENRLVQWFWFAQDAANYTNGALRSDFLYDGVGRLRIRVEFAIPVQASTNPPQGPTIGLETPQDPWQFVSETHYVYDGLRVIQERDGTNTPTVSYTRGNDLGGSLEGAGGIGGLLARSAGYSGGNWTSHAYYHADANGNTTCLIDSSQSAVARYRYDPFGNTVLKLGTLADANVYRFSSKELHVASGMYCYPYRFYDPSLQRWINRDPIEEMGGANLFAMGRNSPQNRVDPFGLLVGRETTVVIEILEGTTAGAAVAGATCTLTGAVIIGGAIVYVLNCQRDLPPSPVTYPNTGPRNCPPVSVAGAEPPKTKPPETCPKTGEMDQAAIGKPGDPDYVPAMKICIYTCPKQGVVRRYFPEGTKCEDSITQPWP